MFQTVTLDAVFKVKCPALVLQPRCACLGLVDVAAVQRASNVKLRSHRHESEWSVRGHLYKYILNACLLTISGEIKSSECFEKNSNSILLHH